MNQATECRSEPVSGIEMSRNGSGLFSAESVLNLLKLILAGSPLPEILAIIARSIESRGDGTLCTIWLPDKSGRKLYCAAAPSLPGFAAQVGPMCIGPKGASCGTAAYRGEPVYVSDILNDPIWDDYRDLVLPYGIRAVWSRPLFARDGKVRGKWTLRSRRPGAPHLPHVTSFHGAPSSPRWRGAKT